MLKTVHDRKPAPPLGLTDLLRPFEERLKDKKLAVDDEALNDSDQCYDVVFIKDATRLGIAGSALTPGGAVLLSIPNAGGMAVLSGGSTGAAIGQLTTGLLRAQVLELARQAGFSQCSFYYAFPDPESPSVVLSEAAFETLDVGNLIEPVWASYPSGLASHRAGLAQWLSANNLFRQACDYFLVVLSNDPSWVPDPQVLAWTFNPGRTTSYKKMNTFYKDGQGTIRVRRQAMGTPPDGAAPIRQVLSDEKYVPGRLYSLGLAAIVSVPGWSAADVAAWAGPWLELLRQHAMVTGTGEWLEGRYLDLVPFNLIESQGQLTPIDLEWAPVEYLPLPYVFFRGLYHSLARMGRVAIPAIGTPVNLYGLCLELASRFFDDTAEIFLTFLTLEPHYFGEVFDGDGNPPGDLDLVLPAQEPSRQVPEAGRLYPLVNLNLQVFVESEGQPFSEETSASLPIALTQEHKCHSLPVPYFTVDTLRLRIDPSDHSGIFQLHAARLKCGETELFSWTPFSETKVTLDGAMLLAVTPTLRNPVMVLLNYDPMLIFSLPPVMLPDAETAVTLEVEVSQLRPGIYEAIRSKLETCCDLLI